MKKILLLIASHIAVLLIGFAAGVYTLPILIAPPAPATEAVAAMTRSRRRPSGGVGIASTRPR